MQLSKANDDSVAPLRPMKIAAEGLIGVGKTTLARKLEAQVDGAVVLCEKVSPGLLELFYSDSGRYGFAMQYAMLLKRNYQAELLRYEPQTSGGLVLMWDRSKLGDLLFALLNHFLGCISAKEFCAYLEEYGCRDLENLRELPFARQLTHVAIMFDDPELCRARVLQRGNSAEQNISPAYYQALEDVHLALLFGLLSESFASSIDAPEVVCLRWGEYDRPQEFLENVRCKPRARLETDSIMTPTAAASLNAAVRHSIEFESSDRLDAVLRAAGPGGLVHVELSAYLSQIRSVKDMRTGPWRDVVVDSDAEHVPLPNSWPLFAPRARRFLARAFSECGGVVVYSVESP